MAFLTFTAGQILTASAMNTISQQTVSTVTTAGRPASPVTGQPIHDTSIGVPFYWSGSQWVPTDHARIRAISSVLAGSPPTTATTRFQIQAGTNVVAINAFQVGSVSFPAAFSSGVVTLTATVGDALGAADLVVDDVTTSGFNVVMAGASSTNQRVNWIAIGW